MTLKETLTNHKIMWLELALNTLKNGENILYLKSLYTEENNLILRYNCFLCEYFHGVCDICIMCMFHSCCKDESIYNKICNEENIEKRSELCYKMAHLFDNVIENEILLNEFSLYEK